MIKKKEWEEVVGEEINETDSEIIYNSSPWLSSDCWNPRHGTLQKQANKAVMSLLNEELHWWDLFMSNFILPV